MHNVSGRFLNKKPDMSQNNEHGGEWRMKKNEKKHKHEEFAEEVDFNRNRRNREEFAEEINFHRSRNREEFAEEQNFNGDQDNTNL